MTLRPTRRQTKWDCRGGGATRAAVECVSSGGAVLANLGLRSVTCELVLTRLQRGRSCRWFRGKFGLYSGTRESHVAVHYYITHGHLKKKRRLKMNSTSVATLEIKSPQEAYVAEITAQCVCPA